MTKGEGRGPAAAFREQLRDRAWSASGEEYASPFSDSFDFACPNSFGAYSPRLLVQNNFSLPREIHTSMGKNCGGIEILITNNAITMKATQLLTCS